MVLKKTLVWVLLLRACLDKQITYTYFENLNEAQKVEAALKIKIKNEVPEWISNQISLDLAGVKAISNRDVETTFTNYPRKIIRYKIFNRNIEILFNKGLWEHDAVASFMTLLLMELNHLTQLPDVDFLVVLDDAVLSDKCSVPVFGFCRKKDDKRVLLIPDYQVFHLLQPKRFLTFVDFNVMQKIAAGINLYPWEHKIPKGIWRGADTGGDYTIETYDQLPRVKLISLSNIYPTVLDAKFNVLHNRNAEIVNEFVRLNFIGNSLSIEDHLKYKYQILIDGHTASWPGAYWRFHTNCAVFKQESDHIEWYYSLLKPYEHYIPFAKNADDLIEKLYWAVQHDEQVQQIVRNARNLCAEHLTYADLLYYFYVVITRYANLQDSHNNK